MMVPLVVLGTMLLIAVIALVVLAVVWATRRSGLLTQPAQSSLDALKQSFARGEVSPEQYQAIKR